MDSQKTLFLQKLAAPIRLSPMVANIQVLMAALGNDELNFRQLAEVLSRYPVIAARLLSLANSAWAAPRVPITSTENACARLGIGVVKSMSIAIAVASSFNQANCPDFDNERFWTKSILVAEGAHLLANRLPKDLGCCPQTAQTAGVLHGLGLLWLIEHLPVQTGQALKQVENNPALSLNEALLIWAGGGYCEAGAWIGKQWQLPEALVVVMQYHQDDSYRGEFWALSLIVGAALKSVNAGITSHAEGFIENEALTTLGLGQTQQMEVFQHLAGKYQATCMLSKELFSGRSS